MPAVSAVQSITSGAPPPWDMLGDSKTEELEEPPDPAAVFPGQSANDS